jgi:hypothetical protein
MVANTATWVGPALRLVDAPEAADNIVEFLQVIRRTITQDEETADLIEPITRDELALIKTQGVPSDDPDAPLLMLRVLRGISGNPFARADALAAIDNDIATLRSRYSAAADLEVSTHGN